MTAAQPIGAMGWLRIVVRLAAMLGLLIGCVLLYYLSELLNARGRNPWPRRFLAGIGWLAGVRVRRSGLAPAQGTFLIANHVSWIDIPALAATSGAAFIAHDGLAALPVLRWLCEMNKTVFVARHDRGSVSHQVQQVRDAMEETGILALFPEGTTGDGRQVMPFKSSLLSAIDPVPAHISVQPALLDYGPGSAEIAWVGDEPGPDNFLKILARSRPVDLTVHFLPPLTGEALTNRKTIAAAAHAALAQALV